MKTSKAVPRFNDKQKPLPRYSLAPFDARVTPPCSFKLDSFTSTVKPWELIEGDCLVELPKFDKVDHVITDPPYEAEAHTLQRRLRTAHGISSSDKRVEYAPLPFPAINESERLSASAEMARLAKRWILVFCQAESTMKWADLLSQGGAKYVRSCVWIKPDGQPQFSGDRPGMGYESIAVCHAPGRTRWNGGGRVGVFSHLRNQSIGREKHPHPTMKPLKLMLELVELFTDPGDLILDPFAGSGTTGVACLRLGRRFIGIEKNAEYAQIARDRLTAESLGQDLRSFRAGQLPMFGEA